MKKVMIVIAILALALAACGGGSDSDASGGSGGEAAGPGDPVAGASVYSGVCSACHGADLQGIDGLGKQLAPSDFVADMTEEELAAFIIVGRAADDPENTQGIAMPERGGDPSLSDQDMRDVAAYLKAQQ